MRYALLEKLAVAVVGERMEDNRVVLMEPEVVDE